MRASLIEFLYVLLPALMLILSIFLTLVPVNVGNNPIPYLDVIVIFFWTAYRPLPVWLVLGCGFLMDILTGVYIGVYPVAYLLVVLSTSLLTRRLQSPSLWVLWGYFAIVLVIFSIGLWFVVMIGAREVVAWQSSQTLALTLTLVLFPVIVQPLLLLLRRIHRDGNQLQSP